MARKREVLPTSTLLLYDVWPHYLANQTLLLISVLSVLFYWLNLSFDSIKMMCGCSSQVAMLDLSAAILDNSFKTSMSFIDTVIIEMLWEFLPLGDYRLLQFFHRLKLSFLVDSLLKSTPNSVIHGINIRAIWRPHVWFNEVDVFFFSDSPSWSGRRALALHPAAVSTCNDDILFWCQAAHTSRGWHCSSMNC